jgi:putative ABC transport system permease protein
LFASGPRENAMKWRSPVAPPTKQPRGLSRRVGKWLGGAGAWTFSILRKLGSWLVARFWATSESSRFIMPLMLKLAARNLFHDRLRFIATIIGIVFSMVLVTVQMGLFLSFARMVTTMIDHTPADLWIMPFATKCFEDPSLLDERERFRAMSLEGVIDAVPMLVSFAQWRVPTGGTTPVLVIGSDLRRPGLLPWNIVAGDLNALSIPNAVATDQTYFGRLGISGLGDSAEMRDRRADVRLVTKGIRSFTTTPYVFTPLDRARAYTGTPPDKATYLLVEATPGTDIGRLQAKLNKILDKAEALTPAEFRSRSRSFWLFGTGAGAALFAGALLGMIVGVVIVAQTLYSSTKDHLNEFATLRAIGSSSRYIHAVILIQAILSACIGFGVAAAIGKLIVKATANSALPVLMTPWLTGVLFFVTIAMCIFSAISAVMQVVRIDPAAAFTR